MSASFGDKIQRVSREMKLKDPAIADEAGSSTEEHGGRDIPVVTDTSNLEVAREGEVTFLVVNKEGVVMAFKDRRNRPYHGATKRLQKITVSDASGNPQTVEANQTQAEILFDEILKHQRTSRNSAKFTYWSQSALAIMGALALGVNIVVGVRSEMHK